MVKGNKMTKDWKTAEVDSIPTCDICGVAAAVVDAGTRYGPWAYMCNSCWHLDGKAPGVLGQGIGQKLIKAGK